MSAASSGLVRLVRDHATVTGGQFVNLRSHWDECRQGRVVVVELFWPGTSGYDSHVTAADLPVQGEPPGDGA